MNLGELFEISRERTTGVLIWNEFPPDGNQKISIKCEILNFSSKENIEKILISFQEMNSDWNHLFATQLSGI